MKIIGMSSSPDAIAPGTVHVRLHAGDPGDDLPPTLADTFDAIDRAVIGSLGAPAEVVSPAGYAPALHPLDRPAIATEDLGDGTIRHTSWWWPDGRQVTVADLHAARLAAALTAERRRWRPRVAADLAAALGLTAQGAGR